MYTYVGNLKHINKLALINKIKFMNKVTVFNPEGQENSKHGERGNFL